MENLNKTFNKGFNNLLKTKIDSVTHLYQNIIRYLQTAKLIEKLLREFRTKPEVLDIGTSGSTFLFKKLLDINITTIDLTNKFKENCKEGIYFKKCDLTKGIIPFEDDSFDIVLLLEVIEHLKMDHNILLKEISRVLKDSGKLIITTPNFTCLRNILLMSKGENVQPPLEYSYENSQSGDIHIREYTLRELTNLVSKTKFKINLRKYANYWDNFYTFRASKRYRIYLFPMFFIYSMIIKLIPRLSRGIQIVCTDQKVDPMKKIYFFANGHTSARETSGGDVRFREIFKRDKEFEKVIITSKFGADIYKKEKIEAEYFITSKENKKRSIFLSYLRRTLKSLSLDLKVSKKDILYSVSDFLPNVFPAFVWKLRNKDAKWIAILHLLAPNPFYGSEQQYLKHKKIRIPRVNDIFYKLNQLLSFKLMNWKADKILVVNTEIQNYLIKKNANKDKIVVIDNGLDFYAIQKVKPLEKNKYDACFVGRFHPQKGIFDLIRIWEFVCEHRKDAKLALIGTGSKDWQERIRKEINKRELEGNIDLLGFMDGEKKFGLIKSSEIFILPSFYESWAMAAMEAMGAGLPVVAYDLPVYGSIYRKGMAKVPIGNVEEFANHVLRLLGDHKLRKKMSMEAMECVSNYDWINTAEKELCILRELGKQP